MAVANLVLKVTGQMTELEKDLQKTNVVLGDFGKQFQAVSAKAAKAQDDLNRSFSGEKIITQAAGIVTAVEKIGGASKLTATEMDRVNRVVTEAIGKYSVLGHDAPPGMIALADATKKVEQEIAKIPPQASNVLGSLKSIAGAIGVSFSVGALISFGKSVFDSASKTHDLAEQLGISTDAVQGFKFAAEQSGSSLDAVGVALTKMNQNLAGGDKATVQALKDAGLQFSQIRNLKPEDAFLAIADAIQQIPDPMKQSDVALAIFGKSAASLLPAIKEGFRNAASGAAKMSEDTIKSLEAAQDAWGKLGDKITIVTGNIIGNVFRATEQVSRLTDEQLKQYQKLISLGRLGEAQRMLLDLADATAKRLKTATDIFLPSGPAKPTLSKDELDAIEKHAKAIRDLADSLDRTALTQKAKDLAEAFALIQRRGHDTPETLKNIGTEAADLFFKGAKLSPQLFQLAIGFSAFNLKVVEGTAGLNDLGLKAELTLPKLSALAQAGKEFADATKIGADSFAGAGFKISDGFEAGAKKIIDGAKNAQKNLDELAQAFSQLGQIAGDSLGWIVRDFGTLIASIDIASKALTSISSGRREGGFQGFLDITTGLVGLTSAAIAAGKALANLFDRNKGRDLVTEFAATFRQFNLDTLQFDPGGGFEQLHARLQELGSDGEKLWIALTQGVGNNNPTQAQAVIDLINQKLSEHKTALDDASQAAKDVGTAESEAMQQAKSAVEELTGKIKSLQDSIANEAPEEVMGIIEQQTRAKIAGLEAEKSAAQKNLDDLSAETKAAWEKTAKDIEDRGLHIKAHIEVDSIDIPGFSIPKMARGGVVHGPTLALIGESGPEVVTPLGSHGLGFGGSGMIQVNTRLEINDREFGRATSVHAPEFLGSMGVR